ncbi:MAG: Uma2 family endonuclease [Herpetosiphonaceae bacterium]|nr:Uma2 family endonuclease [Herpetosiphonaceae bacterium]
MSAVAQQVLTAEELWLLPVADGRRELVRGEVIEAMPPGGQHGAIAVILSMLLWMWAQRSVGGYVGVEAGYILSRNPDTVRHPDVSYIRADRLPASGIPEGFWPLAPDLAVEILSPSETADEVRAKVRDFLNAGTPLVWTLYPRTQEVVVHTPDGFARTYGSEDVLEYPSVLPGFSCNVGELFA